MRARHDHWVTVQQIAAEMHSTSAEICRLLSIGRLTGIKRKQPGRPGKAQWLVDPKSVIKEKHRSAKLVAMARRRKRAAAS